jgi:hypothetical protein
MGLFVITHEVDVDHREAAKGVDLDPDRDQFPQSDADEDAFEDSG